MIVTKRKLLQKRPFLIGVVILIFLLIIASKSGKRSNFKLADSLSVVMAPEAKQEDLDLNPKKANNVDRFIFYNNHSGFNNQRVSLSIL